jgi:MMP endo-(1,4)-3-O-methyl-alpha-D-mannosidase
MRSVTRALLTTVPLVVTFQHLRDDDGAYWTGWQFANQAHFPNERSSWTAAAMILAADALSGTTGGSTLFRDAGPSAGSANAGSAGAGSAGAVDPDACGCPAGP